MNSSKNYFHSSNRSYRHCIKTDFEEKEINEKPYYNTCFTTNDYSSNHHNELISRLNMDKLNNYEKLLNNLSSLSGVLNNFFNVIQGILGTSIDTLITDYSYTNVIEIDKRLQTILKILMGSLKIPYKNPNPKDCFIYDSLREYILFDASNNKIECPNVLTEEDNNAKDFTKINEMNFLKKHKRKIRNIERDRMDLSIRLANCQENEMYKVIAVNNYDYFKEELSLFSTDFQLSNNKGIINLIDNLTLNLFYERRQYIKFSIYKSNQNKKFIIKFPVIKLLMTEKEEVEYVYNKETNEKLIINTKFLTKSKVEMELGVRMKSRYSGEKLFNYSYSLIKLNEKNIEFKENEIYRSELKNFSERNAFDFRKSYMYFNNNLYDDMNQLFLSQKVGLCIFRSDNRYKNAEKILLKEILLPSEKFKNSFSLSISDDIIAEINLNYKNLFTFSQYLKRGLTINMRISIDYTKSNGRPDKKGTLHELNDNVENPYKRAIKTCGEIVAQYDYDKIYAVYGYGAILPNEKTVSHCFNLNFTDDPNIKSIQKVLEVYAKNTPKLEFKFPTNFSHSIRKVLESINVNIKKYNNCYEILLILTDGKVDDFQETVKAIVEASHLPLSIVIIGIGNRDFESMHKLECEEEFLVDCNGKKSLREIVHFVPFSKFENDLGALAEAVFDKLPNQIIEYYTLKKIRPEDLK